MLNNIIIKDNKGENAKKVRENLKFDVNFKFFRSDIKKKIIL